MNAAIPPRFIRAKDAYAVLGTRQVVVDCEAAGWLKPVVRRPKLVLFSFAHVEDCANRIEAGEYPQPK